MRPAQSDRVCPSPPAGVPGTSQSPTASWVKTSQGGFSSLPADCPCVIQLTDHSPSSLAVGFRPKKSLCSCLWASVFQSSQSCPLDQRAHCRKSGPCLLRSHSSVVAVVSVGAGPLLPPSSLLPPPWMVGAFETTRLWQSPGRAGSLPLQPAPRPGRTGSFIPIDVKAQEWVAGDGRATLLKWHVRI